MKNLFSLITGIFIACCCVAQRPAQGPMSKQIYTPQKLGYKLFWKDQFNGDKLDSSKWKIRGAGARALGFVSPEAMKVENGYLKLFALKKGDSMLISAVGTQDKFMTKYGFLSAGHNFRNRKVYGEPSGSSPPGFQTARTILRSLERK